MQLYSDIIAGAIINEVFLIFSNVQIFKFSDIIACNFIRGNTV